MYQIFVVVNYLNNIVTKGKEDMNGSKEIHCNLYVGGKNLPLLFKDLLSGLIIESNLHETDQKEKKIYLFYIDIFDDFYNSLLGYLYHTFAILLFLKSILSFTLVKVLFSFSFYILLLIWKGKYALSCYPQKFRRYT